MMVNNWNNVLAFVTLAETSLLTR